MSARISLPEGALPPDETAVCDLYRELLEAWNARDGDRFAGAFAEDGECIGFDGSQMIGRAEIAPTLRAIFADHPTAAYVAIVRSVRLVGAGTSILRAVVGMVPPGRTDINLAVNAIQTLVAAKSDDAWRIALLQSTPAQFHDRPEAVEVLTAELRALLVSTPN